MNEFPLLRLTFKYSLEMIFDNFDFEDTTFQKITFACELEDEIKSSRQTLRNSQTWEEEN